MKTRLKLIPALATILSCSLVFAFGEKTFIWTAPTAYEDATPLPNADIKEYRIYCDGQTTVPIHVQPNLPLNTDRWEAPALTFAAGDHDCYATAVDIADIESQPSNIVNFTVDPAAPNPPILVVQ